MNFSSPSLNDLDIFQPPSLILTTWIFQPLPPLWTIGISNPHLLERLGFFKSPPTPLKNVNFSIPTPLNDVNYYPPPFWLNFKIFFNHPSPLFWNVNKDNHSPKRPTRSTNCFSILRIEAPTFGCCRVWAGNSNGPFKTAPQIELYSRSAISSPATDDQTIPSQLQHTTTETNKKYITTCVALVIQRIANPSKSSSQYIHNKAPYTHAVRCST